MKNRTLDELIEELRKYNISDRTLEAMKVVKREFFVLNKEEAYFNEALPFFSQTTSQPLVIANIIDELELTKEDIVLEVGTGSGFQTCLIALLAKKVYSFEIDDEIYKAAKENIAGFMQHNPHIKLDIHLYRMDIFKSQRVIDDIIKLENRIDKVVFSFAIKKIPDFILKKVNVVIAPIDESDRYQKLIKMIRKGTGFVSKDLGYVSFVKARMEQ
ncbi:MAG: rRNA adenine N-6-methyltransferase family protein [Candidatus Calescibacterium sp.]|nr:50S ribosomal protein L11 methyltransferase [Candidatus Calescibacterium sp.]MDW8132979.1 rRNA adenine N-6-methyltransferase family protein [Candidatus Calescibacterium sp.]